MPDYLIESRAGGRVAGVDEAGRGPLAGPVLAAAVVLPPCVPPRLAALLDDSKRLSVEQRQLAYDALLRARAMGTVEIGMGAASVADIVRLNIRPGAWGARGVALLRLPAPPDLALIDGNHPPPVACATRCVVGGDALCLSVAAASIVAKVVRDRAMARLARRWPGYGWESNRGYATAAHRRALVALGPTRHHRPTFGAVRRLAA